MPQAGNRFEGQTFFVYDREAVKCESDPPEDAILYYSPYKVHQDDQCYLCGQIIGMMHFTEGLLGVKTSLYKLKQNTLVAKHVGQYSLVLSGDPTDTDSFLIRQLQSLYNLFAFYHGSIDRVRALCHDNKEQFLAKMSIIWDYYIPFVRHYDNHLMASFNPLPSLKLAKNSTSCLLRASSILQTCQRRQHILSGCILYDNNVLCTQMDPPLTIRLLLLKPNQQHLPAETCETDFNLPVGVRILKTFLTREEFTVISQMQFQSVYNQSKQDLTWQASIPVPDDCIPSVPVSLVSSPSGSFCGSHDTDSVVSEDSPDKNVRVRSRYEQSKAAESEREMDMEEKMQQCLKQKQEEIKAEWKSQLERSPRTHQRYQKSLSRMEDARKIKEGEVKERNSPANKSLSEHEVFPEKPQQQDESCKGAHAANIGVGTTEMNTEEEVDLQEQMQRTLKQKREEIKNEWKNELERTSKTQQKSQEWLKWMEDARKVNIDEVNQRTSPVEKCLSKNGITIPLKMDETDTANEALYVTGSGMVVEGMNHEDISGDARTHSEGKGNEAVISETCESLHQHSGTNEKHLATEVVKTCNSIEEDSVDNGHMGVSDNGNDSKKFIGISTDMNERSGTRSDGGEEEVNLEKPEIEESFNPEPCSSCHVKSHLNEHESVPCSCGDLTWDRADCKGDNELDNTFHREQLYKETPFMNDNRLGKDAEDSSSNNCLDEEDCGDCSDTKTKNGEEGVGEEVTKVAPKEDEHIYENVAALNGVKCVGEEEAEDAPKEDEGCEDVTPLNGVEHYVRNDQEEEEQDRVITPPKGFGDDDEETGSDLASENDRTACENDRNEQKANGASAEISERSESSATEDASSSELSKDSKSTETNSESSTSTEVHEVDETKRIDTIIAQDNTNVILAKNHGCDDGHESVNCDESTSDCNTFNEGPQNEVEEENKEDSVNESDAPVSQVTFSRSNSSMASEGDIFYDQPDNQENGNTREEDIKDSNLVDVNVYVQAHSSIVLILFADDQLYKDFDTVKALWRTCLQQLGELEVLLKESNDIILPKGETSNYNFLCYENASRTIKSNINDQVTSVDLAFSETAHIMHEHFQNSSSLIDIMRKNQSTAIYSHQTLGQETYYQHRGPFRGNQGVPSGNDQAFLLETRARAQLLKKHNINLF